jgi:hypothetical protein
MPATATSAMCTECAVQTQFTHSVREHELAEAWVDPLVGWVKDDAFVRADSPMTYAEAMARFRLDTTTRRVGRMLDGVEQILRARGWPAEAAAGVTAYVVNSGSRTPGEGWMAIWQMNPKDARKQARRYVRELTLGEDD